MRPPCARRVAEPSATRRGVARAPVVGGGGWRGDEKDGALSVDGVLGGADEGVSGGINGRSGGKNHCARTHTACAFCHGLARDRTCMYTTLMTRVKAHCLVSETEHVCTQMMSNLSK